MNRALVPDGGEHFAVYLEAKNKAKTGCEIFSQPVLFCPLAPGV